MDTDVRFHYIRGKNFVVNGNAGVSYKCKDGSTKEITKCNTFAKAKAKVRSWGNSDFTLATIKIGNKFLVAYAKRHKDDKNFIKKSGRSIALDRLQHLINNLDKNTPNQWQFVFDFSEHFHVKTEFMNAYSERQKIISENKNKEIMRIIHEHSTGC